jgi:hypothetical protein
VQPDPDRHPHDRLRRDRRGRVRPGVGGRELVLGDDHVHVLQRREQEEPDDRHPAVADEPAQRPHRGAGPAHRPDAPVQRDLEPDRDEGERHRRAEHRAGDVEPGRDEHERAHEPPESLEHDRRADRRVRAQPLQSAALQGDQHPQDARREDRRRAPGGLVDPDRRGDLRPQQHRHRDGGAEREQEPVRPRPQRRAHRLRVPEPVERRLARRGDLYRLAGDEQDQEGRDQRGQRAVPARAEQAREDHGEDELDRVVDERRSREPRRLARFRAPQGIAQPRPLGLQGALHHLKGARWSVVPREASRPGRTT